MVTCAIFGRVSSACENVTCRDHHEADAINFAGSDFAPLVAFVCSTNIDVVDLIDIFNHLASAQHLCTGLPLS